MKHEINQKKGFYLLILFWVTTILSKLILPFIIGFGGIVQIDSVHLLIFLGQVFAFLLPIIIFLLTTRNQSKVALKKENLFKLNELKPNNEYARLPMVLLTFIFYLFIHFLTEAFINLYIFFTKDYSQIITNSNAPFSSFLVLVLVFAVMPAIIEELTYRGLYFDTFKNNKLLLFIVPTLVFCLSHNGIASIITSILLGIYLMMVMYKTHDLKLLLFLHFFYNLLSLIFSNYIKTPFSPSVFIDKIDHLKVVLGASLINLSIAIFLLIGIIFYSKKINTKLFEDKHVKDEKSIEIKVSKANFIAGILLCLSAILWVII